MRSLLLVSADPSALHDALGSGACAVVADLTEGSGSAQDRRCVARDWLRVASTMPERPRLYAVLSGIGGRDIEDDLDAFMPGIPDGVLVTLGGPRPVERPTPSTALSDLQNLGVKLAVREAECGLAEGATGILAAVSAAGVLSLHGLGQPGSRLRALVWDAASVARDLDIAPDPQAAPLVAARGFTVLAAHAAGVPALETVDGDRNAVQGACTRGRRDGFAGALTRRIDQVPLVAAAYGTAAGRLS